MPKVLSPPPERNIPKPLVCCIGSFYALTEITKSIIKSVPTIIKENSEYVSVALNEAKKICNRFEINLFSNIKAFSIKISSEFGVYVQSVETASKELIKTGGEVIFVIEDIAHSIIDILVENSSYIDVAGKEGKKKLNKSCKGIKSFGSFTFNNIYKLSTKEITDYVKSSAFEGKKSIFNSAEITQKFIKTSFNDLFIPILKEETEYGYTLALQIPYISIHSEKIIHNFCKFNNEELFKPFIKEEASYFCSLPLKSVKVVYEIGNTSWKSYCFLFEEIFFPFIEEEKSYISSSFLEVIKTTNLAEGEVKSCCCFVISDLFFPLTTEQISYSHSVISKAVKTIHKVEIGANSFYNFTSNEVLIPFMEESFSYIISFGLGCNKAFLFSGTMFKEFSYNILDEFFVPFFKEESLYISSLVFETIKSSLKIGEIIKNISTDLIETISKKIFIELAQYINALIDESLNGTKIIIKISFKINSKVISIFRFISGEIISYSLLPIDKANRAPKFISHNFKRYLYSEKLFLNIFSEAYHYLPSSISEIKKSLIFSSHMVDSNSKIIKTCFNQTISEILSILFATSEEGIKIFKHGLYTFSKFILSQYECVANITLELINYLASLTAESRKTFIVAANNYKNGLNISNLMILKFFNEFFSYLKSTSYAIIESSQNLFGNHSEDFLIEACSRITFELLSYVDDSFKKLNKIPEKIEKKITNKIVRKIDLNIIPLFNENASYLSSTKNELLKTKSFLKEDLPNSFENHLLHPFLMWWHPKKLKLTADIQSIKMRVERVLSEIHELRRNPI